MKGHLGKIYQIHHSWDLEAWCWNILNTYRILPLSLFKLCHFECVVSYSISSWSLHLPCLPNFRGTDCRTVYPRLSVDPFGRFKVKNRILHQFDPFVPYWNFRGIMFLYVRIHVCVYMYIFMLIYVHIYVIYSYMCVYEGRAENKDRADEENWH